ncbi:hypothetical protein [Treponema primitia]|uniref:hypothetical protein n=1 Tax=Treponema primitia TaxID=88058 RepID=UPI0002555897|nr:hypothetical protein [Treponema primitia]
MKKQNMLTELVSVALIMVLGFILAGCENFAGGNNAPNISGKRYAIVPFEKASRSASEPYVLVSSGHNQAGTVYYYLYYLGYVTSVPIAYKTAYYYDEKTPITITYEKSSATEESITSSMTTAKEHTVTGSASVAIEAGVEAEAGVLFAKAKVTGKITATGSVEDANAVSTSNTYETVETKMAGESESISATIGDHGEAPGKYRYALFGITDVYCLFQVDAATRTVLETDISYRARESSLAWGIDFDSSDLGSFGKTGEGDLLFIPVIDFASIEPDDEVVTGLEPPDPPPPDTKENSLFKSTDVQKGTASKTGGDGNVDTKNNKYTNWEFEVTSVQLINQGTDGIYRNAEIKYIYTVKEGGGDWTVLQLTGTYTEDLSGYKVIELRTLPTQKLSGSISGERHDWVDAGYWNYGLVRHLSLIIDGSGSDEKNIAFMADILIEFVEKN